MLPAAAAIEKRVATAGSLRGRVNCQTATAARQAQITAMLQGTSSRPIEGDTVSSASGEGPAIAPVSAAPGWTAGATAATKR